MSGVGKTITKEGEVILGHIAFNIKDYMRSYAIFKNLPEIQRRISQLEKKN
jgi:UDP-3-O-[3-hydroxymyristoyl] glucosamine N-acyltransferase